MSDQLDRIEQQLKTLTHLLTGNGSPEKGLIVRVDRIEQREKLRSWLAGSALTVALAAAGAWLQRVFGGAQ